MMYADMKREDRVFGRAVDTGALTPAMRAKYHHVQSAYRDAVPPTAAEAALKLREAWKTLNVHKTNRHLVVALKGAERLVREGGYTTATVRELRQVADECRQLEESLGWPEGLIDAALRFLGRPRLAVRND